jgi:predicted regulator of Ras-like GTPase activity (Roadblock/LC7/MglB family)
MKYRQGISRLIRKGRNKFVGSDLMSIEQAVLLEIKQLRIGLPNVVGLLVASADGMLIAHDLPSQAGQPETFAAMSAAQLGLAQQIAAAASRGGFQETITRADDGYVATFAAGSAALLTVVASSDLNVGLLHHEARPVAARVGEIVRPADRGHARGSFTHPPEPLSELTRRERHGRHGPVAEGSDAD